MVFAVVGACLFDADVAGYPQIYVPSNRLKQQAEAMDAGRRDDCEQGEAAAH